jgi:hypothetical protein
MAKKILLTALVGSVLAFVVGSIIHVALGLGEVGIKMLPHEEVVLLAMRASIHDSGLYFFPGTASGMAPNKTTPAEQADYLARYQRGPTGILIYQTGGTALNFPKLLIGQYHFGLAGSLILAWILAVTAASTTFWTRVGIVAMVGLFAGIIYDLPYWNWYGFPTNYIAAHIATGTITWVIAGLGMAAMIKHSSAA